MAAFKTLERHISPDGLLVLLVVEGPPIDGSLETLVTVGFESFDGWHVHLNLFVSKPNGRTWAQIGRDMARDVTDDKMLIAVSTRQGERCISLVQRIEDEVDFLQPGETVEYRFWSGRAVTIEELIDGKVHYKPLSS
ncbi:MAG: hypothetical protein ABI216_19605 [Devosia sp.]